MDLIEAGRFDASYSRRHPWEIARLAHVRSLVARHASLPPGSLACDIGCGDTFVAETLACENRDTAFYAIDTAFTDAWIDALAARRGSGAANLRLFANLDEAESQAAGPASLVLLMDVIEHIEDDIAFLRRLKSSPLVNPATAILITVPAVQALFSAHDRFLGHYRRYSKRQLRDATRAAGLEVQEMGAFFATLLAARAFQAVVERLGGGRDHEQGVGGWHGGRVVTSLITHALRMDASVTTVLGRMGIGVPGLSIYAVCRPSV